MDRHQELDARIERAITDLERRLHAARRRERFSIAILMAVFTMALTGWTPLMGQAPKTMEQRVTDLEKRTGGVQIEDGVTRLTAPLQVFDESGRLIMAVQSGEGGGNLSIGGAEKGYVNLGVNNSGSGYLRVVGSNRKMIAHLGSTPGYEGRGLFLMDNSGNASKASLSISTDERPILDVGAKGEASVRVTVSDNYETGFVAVRDEAGKARILLGSYLKNKLGVYAVGDNGAPSASFRDDIHGGRIQVHNLKGDPVGGLFSEFTGGGLALTDENGGHSVVDLGVRAGGGSVRIHSVGGGPTRAALETDDKMGAFSVFAENGNVAGTLAARASGAGYFQLLHQGVTMVEAGTNADGVGEVRAGPGSQKTVGVLSIPYRLVGRK